MLSNTKVLDDESLLRLTFSPEHFSDGQFKQTAIALDDLSVRGLSVDRVQITPREVVQERIVKQAERKPCERELPVISLLKCCDVRSEIDEGGAPYFDVEASPIEGNAGHASIYSSNRELKRAALRRLREKLLMQMARRIVSLDDVFGANGDAEEQCHPSLCSVATPPTA